MSSQCSATLPRNPVPSRREFLATVGTAALGATAGCTELLPSDEPEGEGDTIEILVENRTPELARIGVRIEDEEGDALFSRVYELESEHLDESAGVETRPATVFAFTPDGTSAEWDYSPDPTWNCDGQDVGISLTREGTFESWYSC